MNPYILAVLTTIALFVIIWRIKPVPLQCFTPYDWQMAILLVAASIGFGALVFAFVVK